MSTDILMPFGAYKNTPLCDIPTAYLRWAVTIANTRAIRLEIRRELVLRELRDQREAQI